MEIASKGNCLSSCQNLDACWPQQKRTLATKVAGELREEQTCCAPVMKVRKSIDACEVSDDRKLVWQVKRTTAEPVLERTRLRDTDFIYFSQTTVQSTLP